MDEALRYIAEFREKHRQEADCLAPHGEGGGDGAQGVPRRQRHPALEPGLPAQAHRRLLPGGDDRRGRAQGRPVRRDALRRRAEVARRDPDEFEDKVEKVRARKDPALEKTRSTFLGIPYFAAQPGIAADIVSSVHAESGFAAVGIPQDPFGSMMITNIGIARTGYGVCAAGAVFARADPARDRRGQGVPVVEDGEDRGRQGDARERHVRPSVHRWLPCCGDVAGVAGSGSSTLTSISTSSTSYPRSRPDSSRLALSIPGAQLPSGPAAEPPSVGRPLKRAVHRALALHRWPAI